MRSMVCPICCLALTTEHKIGLLHSLKVVVLLTKRGHTTSSSPNNRVALDNSIRNSSPLSLYMSTATFHRGLKALQHSGLSS